MSLRQVIQNYLYGFESKLCKTYLPIRLNFGITRLVGIRFTFPFKTLYVYRLYTRHLRHWIIEVIYKIMFFSLFGIGFIIIIDYWCKIRGIYSNIIKMTKIQIDIQPISNKKYEIVNNIILISYGQWVLVYKVNINIGTKPKVKLLFLHSLSHLLVQFIYPVCILFLKKKILFRNENICCKNNLIMVCLINYSWNKKYYRHKLEKIIFWIF